MTHTPADREESLPPVVVMGAGGHCRVLLDALSLCGRRVLFLTDSDAGKHGRSLLGHAVRGGHDLILDHAPDTVELVNGVGSVHRPVARRALYDRFAGAGYRFATVVHPSAVVSASVQAVGPGAQVMAGAVVQTGASIGADTILNTRCVVDHDCVVGDHTHLAPGVTLSGGVTVGAKCHVGTGATVVQGIHIGDRAVVGAGAVVVKDVPADAVVVGVPARGV